MAKIPPSTIAKLSPQPIQFWVVWIAITVGLVPIIQFVGGGFPDGTSETKLALPLLLATIAGAFISTIIRWTVLPKYNTAIPLFITMIIGLALAELTGFLALFLVGPQFPTEQKFALIFSLLAILQYIPLYSKKAAQPPSNK